MGFQADFSTAVRAARKRAGLSQTQLAHLSGVHLNTVSLLERGSADVRMSTMQALCTALNLNLHVQAVVPLAKPDFVPPQTFEMPAFLRKQGD